MNTSPLPYLKPSHPYHQSHSAHPSTADKYMWISSSTYCVKGPLILPSSWLIGHNPISQAWRKLWQNYDDFRWNYDRSVKLCGVGCPGIIHHRQLSNSTKLWQNYDKNRRQWPIMTFGSVTVIITSVREYKYLGFLVTPSGEVTTGIQDLKSRALFAFTQLRKRLGDSFRNNVNITIYLFDTLVIPI